MNILRALALVVLGVLAGCSPRAEIVQAPRAAPDAIERAVYVATSRAPGANGSYDSGRAETLSFGRYSIAIPPVREVGDIRHPRGTPDLTRDFTTTQIVPLHDAAAFRGQIGRSLAALPAPEREIVIFVHGFNTNFAEGVYRAAQLAHDLGLPGVVLHYSWPSLASPFGYAYDRDSALVTRSNLAALVRLVGQTGAHSVTIVAHSMGAHLTMEALRQVALEQPGSVARTVSGLVLFSPDIDIDVFRAQARDIGPLPRDTLIFTSRRDRALQLSAGLSGQGQRLGNIATSEDVADLDVTLLDVTAFSTGLGHFTPGSSPALIGIMGQVPAIQRAFNEGRETRPGLLPLTIITLERATEIILSPLSAVAAEME